MKSLTNKIALISTAFLVVAMGVTFIGFNVLEKQQPQAAVPFEPFCGTEPLTSNKDPQGTALFMANCASCHKLYKRAVGPALSGLFNNDSYPSREYFYEHVRNEQKLLDEKDEYAMYINEMYISYFVHEFELTDEEMELLLDYIAD